MRRVEMVRTRDGKLHESEDAARRWAEKLYGEKLSAIAHRLVRTYKYGQMMEVVDESLEEFVELRALKLDIQMEGDDDNADK